MSGYSNGGFVQRGQRRTFHSSRLLEAVGRALRRQQVRSYGPFDQCIGYQRPLQSVDPGRIQKPG